jgi:plastocyanin
VSLTEEPVTATAVRTGSSAPGQPDHPTSPADEPITSPGDPLVAGALLTAAVLFLTYQLLAGHVIPPLAIFGVLTAGLGVATLRRRPRWLLAVDAGAAILYLGGSVPFIAANLAHPESPVSFLAEVFLVVTLGTVVVGVVLRWRTASERAGRRTATGAVGLALLATIVSLVAAASVDADARQDGDVAIVTERSVFPAAVDVPAREAVLWVDNRDPFHHTFVIDGTDVREVLVASSSVRVPVDLAPGNYRFWCDVPGHETMEGLLDVR